MTRLTLALRTAACAAFAACGSATLALAQDAAPDAGALIGNAALPRDLSPWGMFVNADIVVKAVLIGLAFASVVTWTVWLAKSIELMVAKRRARKAAAMLASVRSFADAMERADAVKGPLDQLLTATASELALSLGSLDRAGTKERIASRLERIEAACGRRILIGTGVLATIGATAPFVGLFGTVWGIMNSFIGIS